MSATFSLRKAWDGWSLVGAINTPVRSTAISNNELYFYSISTSNSISIINNPIGRSTDSSSAFSFENWVYLSMTKAPSGACTNFKFWGPNVVPGVGLAMMFYATAFAKYHTPNGTKVYCTLKGIDYYQIGNAMAVPGRASQVNSASGYFIMQLQLASNAAIGAATGDQLVFHYGFDES